MNKLKNNMVATRVPSGKEERNSIKYTYITNSINIRVFSAKIPPTLYYNSIANSNLQFIDRGDKR